MLFMFLLYIVLVIATRINAGVQKSAHDKEHYRSFLPVSFELADATKTDVIYKLFTDSTTAEPLILTEENACDAITNKSWPTTLLCHGWTSSDASPWFNPMKDVLFSMGPHNVIYINWQKAGNKSYDVSTANIDPVGRYIAELLVKSQVPPENIHFIGHSLGAHLAGFVGKYMCKLTQKKIGRITGLDPAGPKFWQEDMTPDKRLCKDDASFVDVVHTDIDYFGLAKPIGHVDFYPNGGTHQPGCPRREEYENCSHARATRYFIESFSIKVKAKKAEYMYKQNEHIVTEKKNGNEVIFGKYIDTSARGVYTFSTGSDPPYLNTTNKN